MRFLWFLNRHKPSRRPFWADGAAFTPDRAQGETWGRPGMHVVDVMMMRRVSCMW